MDESREELLEYTDKELAAKADKNQLAETDRRLQRTYSELEELSETNAALKRQLDEQDKRIAVLEDLAKSYLPGMASRGFCKIGR